jgi:hypothetical protein
MIAMARLLLTLLLLLGTLAVLGGVRPHWAERLGLGGISLAELRTILEAQRRSAEVLQKEAVVRRRLLGKFAITRDLLDGRLTLFQAAARFRELEALTSEYIYYPRTLYPGATDEERLCRQVIVWAHNEAMCITPSQAASLVERLEAELHEHICQHGTVRLPEE